MQTPFLSLTTINLLPRLVPRTSSSWSIRACLILFKIASRSLSKFKFFVLRLCIICQSLVIVTCGRPRFLVAMMKYYDCVCHKNAVNRFLEAVRSVRQVSCDE